MPRRTRILNRRPAVLVTGAAGFIGFHAIEALLRQGRPVVGIDNFDPFYPRSFKEANVRDLQQIALDTGTPFDFTEADICLLTPQSFKEHAIDCIVHLAAKAGVRPSLESPDVYLRANVAGTLKCLEYARARGIKSFVFGSSSSVYGNDTPAPFSEDAVACRPISPYAATKRGAELWCSAYSHLYGITTASLRFFTVYGPRQRPDLAIHKFTRQIAHGEPIILFGNGETERDYTYVTDIVSGLLSAIEWTRHAPTGTQEVFNLGGSKTTSLLELVKLIEAANGIQAKIKWADAQPGDVERTCANVEKASEILGYRPSVGMQAGIARFIEWYRRQTETTTSQSGQRHAA